MSVPSFRNSRSKVRRRRSHHALKKVQVTACAKCGAAIQPHRACASCGHYNGRKVMNLEEQVDKVLKDSAKEEKKEGKSQEKKKAKKEETAKKATKKSNKK